VREREQQEIPDAMNMWHAFHPERYLQIGTALAGELLSSMTDISPAVL
jgi:hypothetical protein